MSDSGLTKNLSSGPKLYVDTGAIEYNFLSIKSSVGSDVEVMPVLKANAYGVGVSNIAHIFNSCKTIAVADCEEAVSLKKIFPDKNIIILYQPDFSDIDAIAENGFIPGACSFDFLEQLNRRAAASVKTAAAHISIDSGAGRLGVFPNECRKFAEKLLSLKNIRIDGLYTHFSCADSSEPSDVEYTKQQIAAFNHGVSEFESAYGKVKYKHASSSGAIFLHPEARFNMVRPGYILYGYYPSEDIRPFIDLRPSLKLASKIIYIKEVPENTAISYSRRFITKRKSKIATVSIGYSDGLHRSLANGGCLVVNGQKAPIAGTVCMDMIMIDITDIDGPVNIGDEVFVFDNAAVTLDDAASCCGTIGYEVLSHIEDCVQRYSISDINAR